MEGLGSLGFRVSRANTGFRGFRVFAVCRVSCLVALGVFRTSRV